MHTQASSKGRLRVDQACSEPMPTRTPLLSKIDNAVSFVIGGPGMLRTKKSALTNHIILLLTTYILLLSQVVGRGRAGVKITPTPAAASSFARKWASVAPVMVILKLILVLTSNSDFKMSNVAMISALCASTMRGIDPYT